MTPYEQGYYSALVKLGFWDKVKKFFTPAPTQPAPTQHAPLPTPPPRIGWLNRAIDKKKNTLEQIDQYASGKPQ